MSDGAVMSLVRVLTLNAQLSHDYALAAELNRHDEVALVSPDGEPAAAPGNFTEESLDYEYDYTSGARGLSLRGSRMKIELPVDFIGGSLARKLERWKRERAVVYLCPNYGRNTVLSWRPVDHTNLVFANGPACTDLTGQQAMQATFGQYLRYWNSDTRTFVKKSTGNAAVIVPTPGGSGLLTHASVVNRMKPTYPMSATLSSAPTASGWTAGGANAADISASYISNGFGLTDAPHSLRVSVAARTTYDRYLAISDQFANGNGNYAGYTCVNGAAVTFTVWLRGTLPSLATIGIGIMSTAEGVSRVIGGTRFDGWTPVSISMTPTLIDAGHLPYFAIGLNDNATLPAEFEIGPTMISQVNTFSALAPCSVWTPQVTGGTASGTANIATTSALRLPAQGTLVCSYYAPSDIAASWRGTSIMELCGNTDLNVYLMRAVGGNESLVVQAIGSGNTATYTGATGTILRPGQVNTIAVTWDAQGMRLYSNGSLVATDTTTVPAMTASATAFIIGGGQNNYGCAPLALLTMRIDEGAMTADELLGLHCTLTDPGVTHLTVAARGRQFRVTEVPMMVRGGFGGSQVFGLLGLEQVDYLHYLADPANKERNLG